MHVEFKLGKSCKSIFIGHVRLRVRADKQFVSVAAIGRSFRLNVSFVYNPVSDEVQISVRKLHGIVTMCSFKVVGFEPAAEGKIGNGVLDIEIVVRSQRVAFNLFAAGFARIGQGQIVAAFKRVYRVFVYRVVGVCSAAEVVSDFVYYRRPVGGVFQIAVRTARYGQRFFGRGRSVARPAVERIVVAFGLGKNYIVAFDIIRRGRVDSRAFDTRVIDAVSGGRPFSPKFEIFGFFAAVNFA